MRLAQPLVAETKLQPPRVRDVLVPRQRLVDRLRDGRDRRLTVVCAPAGYGKTTLLAQWQALDGERVPFAWIGLDSTDADPVRLWSQIVRVLHRIHPPAGARSSEALAAGPPAIVTVVVPRLLEELSDAPELVLVLEDWHLLRNPLCDEAMSAFVEHAPERLQVVLSARSEPALPLARLRAHDELAEVRAEHLRFSDAESRELFRRRGIELENGDAEHLASRTEGWAVGLHLAAIALRDQPDRHAFVEAFSGDSRHVLDYLARDVFDALPAELRDFLMRSSILDELSAELCDWVLETSGSAAILDEIYHANLFLVAVDESHRVYRYHQLFARMLQREFGLEDPDAVARLHARASTWFEDRGRLEPAVAHAIESRDVRRASELVNRHGWDSWTPGRTTTVRRWLDALSWPEALGDTQLAVVRAATAGASGRSADEIEHWLEVASAEPDRGPLPNGIRSVASAVALLRSFYLTKGLEQGRAAAERTLRLEPPDSGFRRQALGALGQALYLLGRPAEARIALEEARRLPDAPGQAPGTALVLSYLAFLELDDANVDAAERIARDALALLEERHLANGVAAANPQLALGSACMLGADAHGALAHLERAVELAAPPAPGYWRVHALLRLADALHRVGRRVEATAAAESARFELSALPDAGMLEALAVEKEELLNRRRRREGFLGEPLSESELRVLRRLAEGRSLAEVAKDLYLSLNTVKTHRRTIYRKLGATTREEALERSTELGLVDRRPESPG